jgi:uncharacterized protein YukE
VPDLYLTYSSIEAAAADIRITAADLAGLLDEVQAVADGLGSDFRTQSASDAYHGVVTSFVTSMTKAVSGLESVATMLDVTVVTFESTDSALAKGIGG